MSDLDAAAPTSVDELRDLMLAHDRVLPIGAGTKTRLCAPDGDEGESVTRISTRKLSGVTEYDPAEYTFTALAGTPVAEINRQLAEAGQFFPSSALLRDAGATLGGAIASGLSGSGRFRFGGLRDFLLGVRYLDGEGELVAGGGKVVKNAAGFDLPKFMVGSLGRFGVLTEVTFKVFPRPGTTRTVRVHCRDHAEAAGRMGEAAASRWELYAIDYNPADRALFLRAGAPEDVVPLLADDIVARWPEDAEIMAEDEGEEIWTSLRELAWIPENASVAKVPLTPKLIPDLQSTLDELGGVTTRYSVAGNVAHLAAADPAALLRAGQVLSDSSLRGLTFLAPPDAPLWLGERRSTEVEAAIKTALDPAGRFPPLSPPAEQDVS